MMSLDNTYSKEELDYPRESPYGTPNRELKQGLELGQRGVQQVDPLGLGHLAMAVLLLVGVDVEVVWDQQEYVPVSERCAGQTIHREVRQQVTPGTYQVLVSDWK